MRCKVLGVRCKVLHLLFTGYAHVIRLLGRSSKV